MFILISFIMSNLGMHLSPELHYADLFGLTLKNSNKPYGTANF